MDEKMKAALRAWFDSARYIGPEDIVEWAIDYLRSQQEPSLWVGTKLVPYEERTFRSKGMAERLGYSNDLRCYCAHPIPSASAVPEGLVEKLETAHIALRREQFMEARAHLKDAISILCSPSPTEKKES